MSEPTHTNRATEFSQESPGDRPVAHTPSKKALPPVEDKDWDYLDDHSLEVACLASTFAQRFGAMAIGFWIGIMHDIGKALDGFQRYLWRCYRADIEGKPAPKSDTPHAAPGAVFAEEMLERAGSSIRTLVCLPIHGHHSHLREPRTSHNELESLRQKDQAVSESMRRFWQTLLSSLQARPPQMQTPKLTKRQLEFMTRMLLSVLVDADRLSTERHDNPKRYALRHREKHAGDLGPALHAHIDQISNSSTVLGQIRREVYECCCGAASGAAGIFRLTVPTGGGKTLSSLAFALERLAQSDGIVVVALPYTSIIEQTAKVYREVPGIGSENVLEHHSAVNESRGRRQSSMNRQLAAATENWDVPIVVTTTVQLLESLFSDRASKVRKLHRLAGSVIILDEFQSLPPSLLVPTMDVLRLLSEPVCDGGYGATVVLCTATQPSLDSPELREVLDGAQITEIVQNYADHFAALKRVTYCWQPIGVSWAQLADQVAKQDSALVIVNTRRDALALLASLKGTPNLFHLSTLLCGAHRQKNLVDIRDRLANRLPVTLVSTQVVECGVDFSFPVVYRAVGPLDRIVQAAGRCNRNFDYAEGGDVIVFTPTEGATPRGLYKCATEKTLFVMNGQSPEALHDPDFHLDYFFKLFNDQNLDEFNIQQLREQLNFPKVAENYRLINSPTSPVVVKYGGGWESALGAHLFHPKRDTWRALQPYLVNLFDYDIKQAGSQIEEVSEGLYFSNAPYSELRGIDLGDGVWDPSDLYVG